MRKFLVASAAILCSFPALAQVAPPGPPNPPSHAARQHHPHHPGAFACAIRDGKAADFLARARSELRITEGQAKAWDAFAAQVGEAVRPIGERCEPGDSHRGHMRGPLTERLARMEQGQRTMLEVTSKVRAAVDGLWPQLTEEQQRQAGRLMSPRRPGHHGGPRDGRPAGPKPDVTTAAPSLVAPAR